MKNLFCYDSESGVLTWMATGKVAGYRKLGRHIRVGVLGNSLLAHRIIWEMHYGPIPEGLEIDHLDRDPHNNRLSNLRLATQSENRCNAPMRSHNTTGLKGVFWDLARRKWVSYIGIRGKQINLGRYSTKGLAAVAYAKGALRYHGKFAWFLS